MLSDKEFIELGYTYTNVSASRVFQEMWNQVLTEDYIDDIKGSKPVKYPSWEGSSTFDDRLIEDSTLAECPHWKVSDRYWTTFGGIPDQYRNFVGWLIIHIGVTPKRIDCMLHNTLMGYTNPWHNHHLDESPLNILVHMGTRNRTDKDGGRLELGKISDCEEFRKYAKEERLQKNYQALSLYGEGFPLTKVGEVPCNNGDITIINNTNPLFMHQVSVVTSMSPRYTLILSVR